MSRLTIFLILIVVSYTANATILKLDFKVANPEFKTALLEGYNIGGPLNYTMTLDLASMSTWSGSSPSGISFTNTNFNMFKIPKTSFTNEVLNNINDTPLSTDSTATISRQFTSSPDPTSEKTFQGIDFDYDQRYGQDPKTNEFITYQRSIQWDGFISGESLLEPFTTSSLAEYMQSLISDSNFYFNDGYIVTKNYPEQQYSETVDQYGVTGKATLVAVSEVPEPSSLWLLAISLAFLAIGCYLRRPT